MTNSGFSQNAPIIYPIDQNIFSNNKPKSGGAPVLFLTSVWWWGWRSGGQQRGTWPSPPARRRRLDSPAWAGRRRPNCSNTAAGRGRARRTSATSSACWPSDLKAGALHHHYGGREFGGRILNWFHVCIIFLKKEQNKTFCSFYRNNCNATRYIRLWTYIPSTKQFSSSL